MDHVNGNTHIYEISIEQYGKSYRFPAILPGKCQRCLKYIDNSSNFPPMFAVPFN